MCVDLFSDTSSLFQISTHLFCCFEKSIKLICLAFQHWMMINKRSKARARTKHSASYWGGGKERFQEATNWELKQTKIVTPRGPVKATKSVLHVGHEETHSTSAAAFFCVLSRVNFQYILLSWPRNAGSLHLEECTNALQTRNWFPVVTVCYGRPEQLLALFCALSS